MTAVLVVFAAMLVQATAASAAPPAAPAGLTANALDTKVSLSWRSVSGATSYDVYRGSSASSITQRLTPSGTTGTSFTDSSATNGATYFYSVKARNSGGEQSGAAQLAKATPRARSCAAGNEVVLENCFPGTAAWKTAEPGNGYNDGIEGYATASSIAPGQSVDLKVFAAWDAPYHVEIYRTGHYGGTQARLVSVIPGLEGTYRTDCDGNASLGLVDCSDWPVAATVTTTADWTSGVYLLKLVRDDSGQASDILLVVREPVQNSDVVFGVPTSTYQAYNKFDGKSTYSGDSDPPNTITGSHRAVKVSFDRPYSQLGGDYLGQNWYTNGDVATVGWLESQGYDVSYVASEDIHTGGAAILTPHQVFVSGAHDEYWSQEMYNAAIAARDAGTSLLFMGANSVYWRVRFEPSPVTGQPNRVMAVYKTIEGGPADPTGISTSTWRDPAGPNQPENALIGQMYFGQNTGQAFPLQVSAAQGQDRAWRYTPVSRLAPGTTASIGTAMIAWEWDRRFDNGQEPPGVRTIAASNVEGSMLQDNGSVYAYGYGTHNSTLYRTFSGATVFASGTNEFWRGLGTNVDGAGEPDNRIKQLMTNVLSDGGARPSTPSLGMTLDPLGAPQVSSTTPSAGATAVKPEARLNVVFDRDMDPSSIDASDFTVTPAGGSPVSLSVTYDAATRTATLAPADDLLPTTTYTARVGTDVRSWSGSGLSAPVQWNFTTDAYAAPTVTGSSPASNATSVPMSTKVTATFDIPVDPATLDASSFTLTPSGGTVPVSATVSYDPLLRRATLTPASTLDTTTTYTARLSTAVKSSRGVPLAAAYTWSFTTANCPCSLLPGVTPLERNVPTRDFRPEPGPWTYELGLRIVNTTDVHLLALRYWREPGETGPHIGRIWDRFGQQIASVTFQNESASGWQRQALSAPVLLEANREYTVSVGFNAVYSRGPRLLTQLVSGPLRSVGDGFNGVYNPTAGQWPSQSWGQSNYMVDAVVNLPNNPPVAPSVSTTTPANGSGNIAVNSAVTAQFATPLDSSTINPTTFGLTDPSGTAIAASVSYDEETMTARLQPSEPLEPGTQYTARLTTGVRSDDETPLASAYTWQFTTVPPSPPQVTQVTPADGTTDVSHYSTLTATFDQAMSASTVNNSTFKLTAPDGAAVPTSVTYEAAARRATLQPAVALDPQATYTAEVTTGARSTRDVPLEAASTWSFITASCPCSETLRINAGGGAYTSLGSDPFGGDREFAGDLWFTGGGLYSTTAAINGTTDQALYKNERYGQFQYAIPVPAGTYDVRLHFVEIYFGTEVAGGVGKRVFHMDVLDTPASPDLTDIDVYAAVGARTPLIRTISGVTVVDGKLNIKAIRGPADEPELAAVEVIPSPPPGPPSVTRRTPVDGATGVQAGVRPTATFSHDMDPASLTPSSFTLTGPGGASVPATVTYDAGTRTARVQPNAPLSPLTAYTATVTTAARSAAGDPLTQGSTWSFTTAPPDLTPPTTSIVEPSAGDALLGTVRVAATADDANGVLGVQFMLNGEELGSEDTAAPYERQWNTRDTANGTYTLTAVARDTAGNVTTSQEVTVFVDNPPVDPTGLVGAWSFDEGSGATLGDRSPESNDGAIAGASWAPGKWGRALSFNGTDDMVTIQDADSLDLTDGLTLEAWVRPSRTGDWRTVAMKQRAGGQSYGLFASGTPDHVPSGHVSMNGELTVRGSETLPVSQWTHLAVTYDGSTLILYQNGLEVARRAVEGEIDVGNGPLTFGRNNVWDEAFGGRLDEMRVYRRALSAAEIGLDMETPVNSSAAAPAEPSEVGQFSPPQEWPLVPVHISMLTNGKVAVWDGFDAALNSERVWDPETGTWNAIPTGRNLFCAAHVNLPDGRLLIAGGHIEAYKGLADTWLYDPSNNSWFRGTDMARGRWYPTATTLPDGRVLLSAGDNVTFRTTGDIPLRAASETLPEIYDVETNTWTPMPTAQRRMALYPFMFVLPNGKLVDAGPDLMTRTLDVQTGQWTDVDASDIDGHSAVMYRPGKILKSGTWSDPDYQGLAVTNRAQTIDMTETSPAWREAAPMKHHRSFHTLTALPDGTVLASGGGTASDGVDQTKAVLETEIWNPVTNTWTEGASGQRPRLYHSSAVLLPDGRVLLAGGGAFGLAKNETNAEVYSPPYLFKGPRPTIATAPAQVKYGTSFTLTSPDAARVEKVSLVRMGSVTHNFDFDQRFQWLDFTKSGDTLTVAGPVDANTAPPGWYYVSLVDDKGVPSEGRIVRIAPPQWDTDPPSAPANLTAAVQTFDDVKLDWQASSDTVGVSEYRVHRSATPGFTPTATNRIARVTSGLTYTDQNRPPGTYYYVVTAADEAGNVSDTSREEAATIVADTTPPTVSVTAPAAGAVVKGTVSLAATASDERQVAAVQFRVDGVNVGSADTTAPYTSSWNSTTVVNGSHQITAVATDATGNAATSAAITVTVNNNSPPVVALTAPAAGATVSGVVNVTADATDDKGVTSVQFRIGSQNLGSPDTAAPFAVSLDTRLYANGTHSLTAVARDADANATTSAARQVNFANVRPAGLVAAYGFEEAAGGTVNDLSGGGRHGTISGGATRTASGRFGRALSFDGIDDLVSVPDSSALDLTTGMTLEAWVNPTVSTGWRTVLLKERGGGMAYGLFSSTPDGLPAVHAFTNAEHAARGPAALVPGSWSHIAASYNGAALQLHVNGMLVQSLPLTGGMVNGSRPLRLGGNTIWGEWFQGLIDEVRVYNRALTATELQADMNAAVQP